MNKNASKKRLSKNVLEMKFMKRTKEKTELEIENEERQAMFAHEITDAMRNQGGRFIIEPSYAAVESLMFGHRAYNGMNPEIEKMTIAEEQLFAESTSAPKIEAEVTDQEMAQHYSSTMGSTIARKFASKRTHAGKQVEQDGPALLQRGAQLLQQTKSQNKVWTKDGASSLKKMKFIKPVEDM